MRTAHQMYESHHKKPLSNEEIQSFEDKLGLAEAAIISGDDKFIDNISLSAPQLSFIDFRRAQLSNDLESAQNSLKDCVENSRMSSTRDHQLEARARMEWGLLRFTQGEIDESGIDLRWAMERLKAISEGSPEHGLSIINMAAWHMARNEKIMALVQLSQIDRLGPHKIEIIATSRLEISKILFEMGDFQSSQRHSWVAFEGFRSSEMVDSALESILIWLDLSINNVNKDAPLMSEIVDNAIPRNIGDNSDCCAHPDDVVHAIEWCHESWLGTLSGRKRPDLMVLIEAEKTVGLDLFKSKLLVENGVEDKELLRMIS